LGASIGMATAWSVKIEAPDEDGVETLTINWHGYSSKNSVPRSSPNGLSEHFVSLNSTESLMMK